MDEQILCIFTVLPLTESASSDLWNGLEWPGMIQNDPEWHRMTWNGLEWPGMAQIDPKCFRMIQNGSEWPGMT